MKYLQDDLTAHNGACPLALILDPKTQDAPLVLDIDGDKTEFSINEALKLQSALNEMLDIYFQKNPR